jgi:hypothetical protein
VPWTLPNIALFSCRFLPGHCCLFIIEEVPNRRIDPDQRGFIAPAVLCNPLASSGICLWGLELPRGCERVGMAVAKFRQNFVSVPVLHLFCSALTQGMLPPGGAAPVL